MLVILALSNPTAKAGTGATVLSSGVVYKVVPESAGGAFPLWVTNTAYAQGDMVRVTPTGPRFMCVVPGTSTNVEASYPNGNVDVRDGTSCVWRAAMNKPRRLLVIANDGDGTAYVSDEKATCGIGKGMRLNANGGTAVFCAPGDDVPQGAIYIVSSNATSISHFER